MRKNVLPAIPITSLSARINLQLWLAVFFTGFTHCLPANPQAFMLTERHSSGLLSQSAVLRNHKELTAEGNRSQAQARKRVTQQGQQITLNGQQFLVAWQQWEEGNITHTGISDVGAREIFGLNLLTTHEVSVQPIAWFSSIMKLDAYLVSPYRYLDITDFARKAGWQLKVLGDTLIIQSSPAQIVDIQQERGQSQKITVYLDRPTVWQVDRARGTLTINIDGVASTLARFRSRRRT